LLTNFAALLLLLFGVVGLVSSRLTERRWRGIQCYPAAFGLIISVWSVTGLLSWFFADFRKMWISDTPRSHCLVFALISMVASVYLFQEAYVHRLLTAVFGRPPILITLIVGTLLFFAGAILRAIDYIKKSGLNVPQS